MTVTSREISSKPKNTSRSTLGKLRDFWNEFQKLCSAFTLEGINGVIEYLRNYKLSTIEERFADELTFELIDEIQEFNSIVEKLNKIVHALNTWSEENLLCETRFKRLINKSYDLLYGGGPNQVFRDPDHSAELIKVEIAALNKFQISSVLN